MGVSGIQRDIEYLAGVLHHRGSNTHSERVAAEYVEERFREYTPDVAIEDFHSIETPFYALASAYGEFLFVALVAFWFPRVAFWYGIAVFVLYLAEVTGYRTFSRLLPHYESQNVAARFPALEPGGLIVVTAHYDSAKATPLSRPRAESWLSVVHLGLVVCMFLVLASCVVQAAGLLEEVLVPLPLGDAEVRLVFLVRWVAVGCLLTAAGILLYYELTAEYARGANDNASGVAALLALAESLKDAPVDNCDVWLVATGSKAAWLNGIRRLVTTHEFDRDATWFINIDRVGQGRLCYVIGEGILYPFRSPKEMVRLAASLAPRHGARDHLHRGWPTDLLVPLARGYKALGITAVPPRNVPEAEAVRPDGDRSADVDLQTVVQASRFAEAIVRELAVRTKTPSAPATT